MGPSWLGKHCFVTAIQLGGLCIIRTFCFKPIYYNLGYKVQQTIRSTYKLVVHFEDFKREHWVRMSVSQLVCILHRDIKSHVTPCTLFIVSYQYSLEISHFHWNLQGSRELQAEEGRGYTLIGLGKKRKSGRFRRNRPDFSFLPIPKMMRQLSQPSVHAQCAHEVINSSSQKLDLLPGFLWK